MKTITIALVLVFTYNLSKAQNSVRGTITDQDSLPLQGAVLYIPELSKGTTTDQNGNFVLTDLPDGSFKMKISYVGFSGKIVPVNLTGKEIIINVSLHFTSVESEEIVVTGGYHSTQHENAVKIEVLKVNLSTNKASPNFAEVLASVPGVDMISKGSGVSKPVIRGLSMNDILILNNGVRFENYQYSSHHPLGIDEFGIEDIEIIKGPASLLYGSDAIGGVINFIKEKPAPKNSYSGSYNMQLFSNSLGMANHFGIKGASEKFFGGIHLGQKTHADYLQGGGKFVANSRFNEYSSKINAGHTSKTGSFRLYYDYNSQKIGLVEEEAIEEITVRGRKNEIFYQKLNTHLISSQNKVFFGRSKMDINLSFQNTELVHLGEMEEYEIQMRLSTLSYETKIHLPFGKRTGYIFGFQGINQRNMNISNRETILLPDAGNNNYSGFALLQYSIPEKLKVQTGLRYDYKILDTKAVGTSEDETTFRRALSKDYGSFSGSAGATYHITKQLLVRTNFASAYRTPNLAELTSNGPHETRYELGDQDLVPENSYEADLSLHLHRDNLTFDMAGFFNRINNYIYIAPTGDTSLNGYPLYKYLQSNSLLYGGEAGLHIHPSSLKWLHLRTTFSAVIGKQYKGSYLPFIPAHKLNFEISAEKDKLLFIRQAYITMNSYTAFAQNNSAPDETTTMGYTLIDCSIGGKIKTVIVSISATNVFDLKYVDHLSTLKEANRYNPGRNFVFSLSIPFGIKQDNDLNP